MELNGRSLHPYFKLLIEELSIKNKFPLDELLIERCIVLFGLKYPELVLWPEQFEFRRMNNKYCQYIGSYISLERKESYLDLSFLSDQKFVVYFSIGTILQNQRLLDFLLRLMDSFRGLMNCEFIVSAGKLYNHLESIRVPSNVFLYEHVPQLQVLSRTDLMITLAGGNSIKECIALGVPMLCYPFQSDQFGNASRVRFHKMGLVGSLNDSSEEIRFRINEILGNRDFVGNVEKFNETSSKEEASSDHIQALFTHIYQRATE